MEKQRPILVSACLLGLETRYDGGSCPQEETVRLADRACVVPVCPEQLGGLSTPRPPAEIASGDGEDVLDGRARLRDCEGREVTAHYLRGAEAVARIAALTGAARALLKEGSPACGVSRIKRDGRDVSGCGVTAALLRRKGVKLEGID